jgi:Cu-Zn family superoxide dismutase
VDVVVTAVSLESGKENSLLDQDGSSLVLHAKADDNKSDPAGNSGDRVICGVIGK